MRPNMKRRSRAEINDLILSYARGEISKEVFAEEKVRIFGVATDKGKDAVGNAMEYADNLLEIAEQVKEKASYDETLENLDLDLDVVIGQARAGVRTEAQFDTVDRIVEKLRSKRRLGGWRMRRRSRAASLLRIRWIDLFPALGAEQGAAVARIWRDRRSLAPGLPRRAKAIGSKK